MHKMAGEQLPLLKIGELARRAGTTLRTVRYYEQMGLITAADRTKGGFRLYSEEELQKVQFIKKLQLLDFPLCEIKKLIQSRRQATSGAETFSPIADLLVRQLKETERRISVYQELQQGIRQTMEILKFCAECPLRPTREVCEKCPVICGLEEVPLPMRVLISAS